MLELQGPHVSAMVNSPIAYKVLKRETRETKN